MQKLKWTRSNRDAKTSGTVNGVRRGDRDYISAVHGSSYFSAFILPMGTEEPIVIFADDNHADGFEGLLEFARDCAANGSIRAREALKLMGEEL